MKDVFMAEAIKEAEKSFREGGIPIGSVLVRDEKIIGRGHNQRIQKDSQILHAEIDCLQNAGKIDLKGTTLYSTLMPCYLCAGAAVQFGIKKIIAGESKNFAGAREFMQEYGIKVIDLDLDECKQMMSTFIKNNPSLWNEDIGKQ